MEFVFANWTALLIGILASLLASAIVGFIAYARSWPPVPVPSWLIILMIAIPCTVFGVYSLKSNQPISIVDQIFESERVYLDGKKFIRCQFDRCNLIFRGELPFGMESCGFTAPKIIFEGAAGTTLYQMKMMKKEPNFAKFIDGTWSQE